MEFIDTIIKGFILIAMYALISSSTVVDMKNMDAKTHKRGPMSFSTYTKSLTK